MTVKRILFMGGAVLVLAACSDSVAPTAGARAGGEVASVRKDSTATTSAPTTTMIGTELDGSDCRSGFVIPAGRTDTTGTECSTDQQ